MMGRLKKNAKIQIKNCFYFIFLIPAGSSLEANDARVTERGETEEGQPPVPSAAAAGRV